MNIRERFIKILGKYWWVLLIIVGIGCIGYFFTDIPIFKYLVYIIAVPIALIISLPFIILLFSLIIQLFSPAFVSVLFLIKHFREAERMPFGKKYIFIPMSLVSVTSFLTAQMILSVWVFILSFVIWTSVIGFFWTFLLTFLLGLAPIAILTAPFLVWYKEGFAYFLGIGIFFLMALFWFGFSKLAFSKDYSSTPEDFLGYSPQIFLLGALSFQVIALPFCSFKMFEVGNIISGLGGGIFLPLTLIAAFKWRALKKKLSIEEKKYLYRPPVWVYILGYFFTRFLWETFDTIAVPINTPLGQKLLDGQIVWNIPTGILNWLNTFFLITLIIRFFGLLRRKPKIKEIEYESKQE